MTGIIDSHDIAPVHQWQIIQTGAETMEIGPERNLSGSEEQALRDLVKSKLEP